MLFVSKRPLSVNEESLSTLIELEVKNATGKCNRTCQDPSWYYEHKSISQLPETRPNRPKVERRLISLCVWNLSCIGRLPRSGRPKISPRKNMILSLACSKPLDTDIHMNYGHNVYWQKYPESFWIRVSRIIKVISCTVSKILGASNVSP